MFSHYSALGGVTPYNNRDMKRNVVDQIFGESNYDEYHEYDDKDMYKKVDGLYRKGYQLYLSASAQGSAYISEDGTMIKANILMNGSIKGVMYVMKNESELEKKESDLDVIHNFMLHVNSQDIVNGDVSKYAESYDYLMQVVQTCHCEAMELGMDTATFYTYFGFYNVIEGDKDDAIKAIVKFINWYNV